LTVTPGFIFGETNNDGAHLSPTKGRSVIHGPVLWGFSVALLWGVVIGTYSTIYVAAPLEWYMAARGRHLPPQDDEPDAVAARP